MRKPLLKQCSLFLLLTLPALQLYAQEPQARSGRENSPYSRFGIGILSDAASAPIRGMGGTATAFSDGLTANTYNPASYSFLLATTFDFGFETKNRTVGFEGQKTANSLTGNVSYFNFGFPIAKHGGFVFGYQPISNTFYNQSDSLNIGTDRALRIYRGDGSINYGFVGLAGKIKGFSAGINFGYAFGNLNSAKSLLDINSLQIRNGQNFTETSYGGIYWKGGLMYRGEFAKSHYLNIGATGTLSQTLKGNRSGISVATSTGTAGIVLNTDTITNYGDLKGDLKLPSTYSFGTHYGKDNYFDIGVDYTYSDWSQFANYGDRLGISDNSYRVSIGGNFTPNPLAINRLQGKYLSAVTYMLGLNYGKEYVQILNKAEINYYGGSFGASFPFRRNNSNKQFGQIHTVFDIGRRGTFIDDLAREFYIKFTLGVSLNDVWFQKRKFN